MISLDEKSMLNPKKCVQLIQEQDEKKILKKLMNSKKLPFSQRFQDPIISEVYVECEDDLNFYKRSKTEKYIGNNCSQIRSLVKYDSTFKNRHLYSQSVELPNLLKLKPNRKHTYLGHHSHLSSKRGSVLDHETNFRTKVSSCFESKEKLIEIVEKVYKDSQKEYQDDKELKSLEKSKIFCKKVNTKKIKLEKLKKPETPGYVHKKEKEISHLKIDTYFVKLMQNKIKLEGHTQISEKIFEGKPPSISEKNFVPKTEDVPEFIKGYTPIHPEININELIKSSNFHIILDEEKDIYFGSIKEGKKVGQGIFVNENIKLEGKWENDEIVYGYEINPQGFYKGKFEGNKRSGEGEFKWKNGENYNGEWKNGVRHGTGVWKSGKGDSYIGNWTYGKVEGYGVHMSASGQKYEGFFKNFLKHGKAKEMFPNGDMYEGDYREGKPNGKGKYTWKNIITYEGEFVEGYRHGKGIIKSPNGMKFEGDFIAERPNGKGDLTYENGDNYIGTFKDGEKDGFGTMKLAEEHKVIIGKWEKDQFEK